MCGVEVRVSDEGFRNIIIKVNLGDKVININS